MALPCPWYCIQCGRLRFANTPLHRAPHEKETLTIRAVTPAQAGVQRVMWLVSSTGSPFARGWREGWYWALAKATRLDNHQAGEAGCILAMIRQRENRVTSTAAIRRRASGQLIRNRQLSGRVTATQPLPVDTCALWPESPPGSAPAGGKNENS